MEHSIPSHVLFYSGAYQADVLGSTKAIDAPLTKKLAEHGLRVTWAGRGVKKEKNIEGIDLNSLGDFSFFKKIIVKADYFLYRILAKLRLNNLAMLKLYTHFDSRCAYLINSGKIKVDSSTIFIARNGMSLYSFQAVKRSGGVSILHSQWMHPAAQNKILKSEFSQLQLKKKPISPKRIKRQLKEINFVDKIWCISSLVYSSYIENEIDRNKLFYLPLGVDTSYYYPKGELGTIYDYRKSSFKILFVGNVNPEKGAHLLIEALKISGVRNCEIIFNGALPAYFQNTFKNSCNSLIARNITIRIEPGDPKKNYIYSSLFVLPSVHESFGMVVLEAMASGLPILVSSSVGAKDCVQNGKNGFIFESKNVKELAQRIDFFYSNRQLIQDYGLHSLEQAKEYDWNIIGGKFIAFIKTRFINTK